MVIKNKVYPGERYVTRVAKEIKLGPIKQKLKHTRKCRELSAAKNYKKFVEKKLTPDQQKYYGEVLSKDRDYNERFMDKKAKKKKMIVEVKI